MDFLWILLIAVGLAMDAFAVSVGAGTSGQARSARSIFRLSFHMGLFQGLMTFLGWLVGSTIAAYIASFDHWIALGLLAFVGGRMIYNGLYPEQEAARADVSRGGTLLMVCIATSIDAMAVGLGMAMLKVNIAAASMIIAVVTLALSLFGLLAGDRLGRRFGPRMEVLGGLILCFIGIRIVVTHLL